MKNKKTIRLLAATWLIAPSVLSTNTVFAVDNQIADQTVTTDTTTSSSATSETTDSFTEDPTGTTNSTTGSTEPTEIDPGIGHVFILRRRIDEKNCRKST